MGVVYLANDTRLDRQVAIKALPTELAADPARLERFEREAKTLASLNHPNLAGIYGVEEQEGARYLVLEFLMARRLSMRWIVDPCRSRMRSSWRRRSRRASKRRTMRGLCTGISSLPTL
jgi:serine/threonine protein kinase